MRTDADNYHPTDAITIEGQLSGEAIVQTILLQVLDNEGNRILLKEVDVASNGSYTYSFASSDVLRKSGIYAVLASYKDMIANSKFSFEAGELDSGWAIIQAKIGDKYYPIECMISGNENELLGIEGSPNSTSISVSLNTRSNGTLSLRFNEQILDAKEFSVLKDGVKSNVSHSNVDSLNEIWLQFESGSKKIEIMGDRIVPEFGAWTPFILAVMFVSAILYSIIGKDLRRLRDASNP